MIAALLRRFAAPASPAPVAPSTAPFTDLSHFDNFNAKQLAALPRTLRSDVEKFRRARTTLRLGHEIAASKGQTA